MIPFQSLTMRIWFIISVIVSTIVVVVSLAFAFLIQDNNQDKAKDMLQMTHQDEIGRLASAMKEMKEALQLADEEERKFLQSISHLTFRTL